MIKTKSTGDNKKKSNYVVYIFVAITLLKIAKCEIKDAKQLFI